MNVELLLKRRYGCIDAAAVSRWMDAHSEYRDRYARAIKEVNRMTDNGDVLLQQTEDGHHRFVDASESATCSYCGKEIHKTVPREWNAGNVYHVSCWEEVRPIAEPDGRWSVDAPAEQEIAGKLAPFNHARKTMVIGAQVELKSGGPVMTVNRWTTGPEDYITDSYVEALWFDGANLEAAPFHWSMLKLAGVVLEKRPVAWRVGGEGGIIYTVESDTAGHVLVDGLYLRDGT